MLSLDGCRLRQDRFIRALEQAGYHGALVSHPRDIYYFTGLWVENPVFAHPSLLFLSPCHPSWLGTWRTEGQATVEKRDTYGHHTLYTMNPDNYRRLGQLAESAGQRVQGKVGRLGFQAEGGAKSVLDAFRHGAGHGELAPMDSLLTTQQLRKDADEIACIRRALDAAVAAYTRAAEIVRPGINELEVLAECRRAANAAVGQSHYLGGDFRSGETGGPARDRAIVAGELYIIDLQTDVNGYWCDLSRAWIVGEEPTSLQQSVFEHIARILRDVPKMVKPGASCLSFWKELDSRIREHAHLSDSGLTHHGGHGIGLRAHEMPDINALRDSTFEIGNTFTVEPGAYSSELRAGVRLEDNFVITENGVELLAEFPLNIFPTPPRPTAIPAAN